LEKTEKSAQWWEFLNTARNLLDPYKAGNIDQTSNYSFQKKDFAAWSQLYVSTFRFLERTSDTAFQLNTIDLRLSGGGLSTAFVNASNVKR
jgi:hypothetical protein